MYIFFFLIALPLLLCMVAWAVVTAYRIFRPTQPLPFERDPVIVRQKVAASGAGVPVGVREIREDQRYHQQAPYRPSYRYAFGGSEGLPPAWKDDLWLRRN